MTERKKVEIAVRRKFILDKTSISRGPSDDWFVTVRRWKIGSGSGATSFGDPVVYRAVVSGDNVTFTQE